MELLQWNYFQIALNIILVSFAMGDRSIVTGPDNTTLSLGDSVTLTCIVTDDLDGETVVTWKQNGLVITEDYYVSSNVDGNRYSVMNETLVGQEYNLHITSVNTLDAGVYTCTIISLFNPLDTVASSSSAWLSYKSPPRDNFPECTPSGDMTYRVGDRVSFSCRSEVAVPPVELSWVRETGELLDAEESTQGRLRVSKFTTVLSKEDNGKTFECDLTHELVTNERSCVVGRLNVQYPPTDVIMKPEVARESNTVLIHCRADANPPINASAITWSFSDIPKKNVRVVRGNILLITDVTASFNGTVVECVVRNELGEASGSFTLRVNNPSTTASTKNPSTTRFQSTHTLISSTHSSSTMKVITDIRAKTASATTKPLALPDSKYTTIDPRLTLDKILGVERNFLIAFMIGAGFLLLCFVLLLILLFGRKRTKTIVVVNSEDNLRNLSLSATSVNGSKIILHTPVMDRRNRTGSDNPSDDQSFDSAIHLISPVTPGEQPDYRTHMFDRSKSNISAASSQASRTGFMKVPSTELLINSQSQERFEQPRYVVLDLLNQNGLPFPCADPGQVCYNSATTGRATVHHVDNKGTGFETIPLRSVRRDQSEELYVFQGGQYIPVQHVMNQVSPPRNNPVKIMIGGTSEEELNIYSKSSLDPRYRPV